MLHGPYVAGFVATDEGKLRNKTWVDTPRQVIASLHVLGLQKAQDTRKKETLIMV